jgi:hypothetical protein
MNLLGVGVAPTAPFKGNFYGQVIIQNGINNATGQQSLIFSYPGITNSLTHSIFSGHDASVASYNKLDFYIARTSGLSALNVLSLRSSQPVLIGAGTGLGLDVSGSTTITGSLTTTGNITSAGTLTAQTLVVQTITSSVLYSSGSNIFGNALSNTQVMTGSVSITGSLSVMGGSVGIGTTSPTNGKLVVKSGESNSTGIVLERGSNTDKLVNIFSETADGKIAIASGANTRIFLDSVGNSYFTGGYNVGIGTTSPTGRLMLYQSSAGNVFQNIVSNQGSSTQAGINFSPSMTDAEVAANPAQASIYATDSNYGANIIFATKATGSIGNALTERMRITSGGNVLIGTTTDAGQKLQVNGALRVLDGNVITLMQPSNGNGSNIRSVTSGDFRVTTGGTTDALIISNGGNVLIGTTTDNGEKLQVVGGSVNMFNYTSFTTSTKTAASNVNIAFDLTADYGRGGGDNIGGLVVININQTSASTSEPNAAYVGIVINPRGAGGSISQISRLLGAGVSALSVFMSGNSILVNAVLTSGGTYRASLTFIGGGGTS